MTSFELVLEFIKYHDISLYRSNDENKYLFCSTSTGCSNYKINKLCHINFGNKLPLINEEELYILKQLYIELFI